MHTSPQVSIVVLNYNGRHCLLSCLTSLEALLYREKDIIVVDNASGDGSLDEARKCFPHFTYIRNEKNEGFAKGMNLGMKLAISRGAEWVWIFNYDAIALPDSLDHLIMAAEGVPETGLLSPLIYEADGEHLWFAKGRVDFLRMRTIHILPKREDFAQKSYASDFLTGCALLIKKELIERSGFLDERFFLYYEDADYSLRAARAGFSSLVVPAAKVLHSEISRENPKKVYFLVYSGLLFFKKWTPLFLRPYLALYVTIRMVKNFFDRLFGKGAAAREVHRAYRQYFYERHS